MDDYEFDPFGDYGGDYDLGGGYDSGGGYDFGDLGGGYGYGETSYGVSNPSIYGAPGGPGGGGGSTGFQDYMPGGSQYLPPGSGMFQSGEGDWQGIYAPGSPSGPSVSAGVYDTMRGAPPDPRTSGYGPGGGAVSRAPTQGTPQPSSNYPQPRPASPSAQNVAQQPLNFISLGQPQDDLYKRYKSLLTNPDFSGDPTYKFLYNQGLQGLNRNLAARRMSLSGKSMNDTMAYGSGMASKYMQDLLPQYQAGAQEELRRFMGPAGLLSQYARTNNAAIGQGNTMVNQAEDRAMMQQPLDLGNLPMGENYGGGIGYGGVGGSSNPTSYATNSPGFTPRPLSFSSNPNWEGADAADNLYDPDYLQRGP